MFDEAWLARKQGKTKKTRKKPKKEEHEIQVGLFEWIDLQKKIYPQLENAYAIPNGGSRNEIEGSNLKAEGVRPGVWDICLAYPSNGFHGLYVEVKTPKGSLSVDVPILCPKTGRVRYVREGQVTWKKRLEDAGYCCMVGRSVYELIDIFKTYLGIT